MKGPFERLKYDMRRLWECPVCQHRERAAGSVTSRMCGCQEKREPSERRTMRLVQEGGLRAGAVLPEQPPAEKPAP